MSSNDVPSGCANVPAPRVSSRRLLILCAASLAAGIGAAKLLDGRGSVSYSGTLRSLTTTITAERATRIQEVVLIPGQRVVPGDKLAQLTDDQLLAQIANQRRELVELTADLKRVQAKADVELEWRKRELNGEIFQTQMKVSTVTQERTSRQVEQLAWQDYLKNLQGSSELTEAILPVRSVAVDSPFADERRLQAILKEDAAAVAAEALTAQLALCEQQLDRLRKLEQELPDKVRVSAGVNLVETRIERAREELSGLERQCEALSVVSPAHGIVGTIHHRPGDMVQPGDPLVELLDDERRHLIAYIPSSAATKLQPGTRVELVFPGNQRRIGLVSEIPPHAIPADQRIPLTDSQVEVKVEPAGKLWPKLPVGSRVQVQVLQ
ncbi:MAG: HlyD family efflux transporter periplasmic adaptor subunit [Planctomycetes bacterium]|nr:HlyD family efflux transporter periplasmic adaptor subunit [Planctomycetota bacterium]